jgi:hypothetical protein
MVILRWLAAGVVIFLVVAVLTWAGIILLRPDMNLDLAFSIIFYSATGVTIIALFFIRKAKLLIRNGK